MAEDMDEAPQARYRAGFAAGDGIAVQLAVRALISVLAEASEDEALLRAAILRRALTMLESVGATPPDDAFLRGVREAGKNTLRAIIGPDPAIGHAH